MTGNQPRAARSPRRARGSPPRQATPPPPHAPTVFLLRVLLTTPCMQMSGPRPPPPCYSPCLFFFLRPHWLLLPSRPSFLGRLASGGSKFPPARWGPLTGPASPLPRPPPIVMTAMRTARPHRPRAATNCPDGPAPPLHCPAPPGRFPGSPVDCVCAPAPCAGGHPMTLTPPPFLIATLWPMDPLHVRPSHVAPFDPIILSSGWSLGLRHRWIPAVHPSFSPQPRRLALPDHPRLPSCSAPAAPDPRPSLGTTPRSVYIRIPSVPCCPSDPGGD